MIKKAAGPTAVLAAVLLTFPTAALASSVDVVEAIWPGYDSNSRVQNAEPVTVTLTLDESAADFEWFYFQFLGAVPAPAILNERNMVLSNLGECRDSGLNLLFTVSSNLPVGTFQGRECAVYDSGGEIGFGFGYRDAKITGLTEVTVTIPAGRLLQTSSDPNFTYAEVDSRDLLPISFVAGAPSGSGSSEGSGGSSGESPSPSGIFLHVAASPGRLVEGAPVYHGSVGIAPGTSYTLSFQSMDSRALTRTVLASGVTNGRGHVEGRTQLGTLAPGTYKIVMTGTHASEYPLVLTNHIVVDAAGKFVSVSPESLQPTLR